MSFYKFTALQAELHNRAAELRKLESAILYIISSFVSYIRPFVIHLQVNLVEIIRFEIFEIKLDIARPG